MKQIFKLSSAVLFTAMLGATAACGKKTTLQAPSGPVPFDQKGRYEVEYSFSQTVPILQEAPGNQTLLIKFRLDSNIEKQSHVPQVECDFKVRSGDRSLYVDQFENFMILFDGLILTPAAPTQGALGRWRHHDPVYKMDGQRITQREIKVNVSRPAENSLTLDFSVKCVSNYYGM